MLKKEQEKLKSWYLENKRELPWRISRNPYLIWISEVMLQQTTVTAVIPFYQKFIQRFPNLQTLAQSSIEDVYEYWAGLGYYSRARNLHKAAQLLNAQKQFPQTAQELIEYPGFGPYTSRSVSSIAFDDPVGVLDGNVIRVLCRYHGLKIKWWDQKEKNKLQALADQLVQGHPSHIMNQAIMELGATICTPQKTLCMMCPWQKTCQSFANGWVETLPLKKPRKEKEYWIWKVQIHKDKNKLGLVENDYTPFLKGTWIFPGTAEKVKTKPKVYDTSHTITHHHIYVQIESRFTKVSRKTTKTKLRWIELKDLKKINPANLLQKVISKI